MSGKHIEQMRRVRDERNASHLSLTLVLSHWNQLYPLIQEGIADETLAQVTPRHVQDSLANLDATYFIRLFAVFEGILKDHLSSRQPAIALAKDSKVDWLVSKTLKHNQLKIDKQLRLEIDNIRDYRNALAHKGSAQAVTFQEALRSLNLFLAKLPD